LRGLPIIGNLWATGRNIKDLLEGTVDDEKRLRASNKIGS
jgi:hypothetical protein